MSSPAPPPADAATDVSVDVVVIGAGPAGCAAALTLARGGRSVILADKATFPRDKICGDGLTTLALRLLEDLGLDPASVATWMPVADCNVSGPAGHRVLFPLPADAGQYAAISRREDLDAALLDIARPLVTVFEGHKIESLAPASSGTVVTLSHADGERIVTAGAVIAADGMWSPTRKLCACSAINKLKLANASSQQSTVERSERDTGRGGATSSAIYKGEWHAARQYYSNVAAPAANELHVWFDADLLPGYAWSFPLGDGRANVGFGVLRSDDRKGAELKALWADILARPHVRDVLGPNAAAEGVERSWPIPARVDAVSLHHGATLFVGDAAAATDLLTGEGIGQALLTGIEAANAILAGGSPSEIGNRYAQAVRKELVADHRMSVALGRMLAQPWGARFAIRTAGLTGWTRRNFARWLFEDYPRALAFTPRRWHKGMFTGPGAYRNQPNGPTGASRP